MKMGNSKGHRKEHGVNKGGWASLPSAQEKSSMDGGKRSCTLINNALYNLKGTEGLSFPK